MRSRHLTVFALIAILAVGGCRRGVIEEDRATFIKLVNSLPHQGEFFTDAAIDQAAPSIRVLFCLTEKDLAGRDLYPFAALSRGLCDRDVPKRYAINHFEEIAHPELRLLWAIMLFDANAASPEVVEYLRRALDNENQARLLASMTGPKFAKFKERVLAAPMR